MVDSVYLNASRNKALGCVIGGTVGYASLPAIFERLEIKNDPILAASLIELISSFMLLIYLIYIIDRDIYCNSHVKATKNSTNIDKSQHETNKSISLKLMKHPFYKMHYNIYRPLIVHKKTSDIYRPIQRHIYSKVDFKTYITHHKNHLRSDTEENAWYVYKYYHRDKTRHNMVQYTPDTYKIRHLNTLKSMYIWMIIISQLYWLLFLWSSQLINTVVTMVLFETWPIWLILFTALYRKISTTEIKQKEQTNIDHLNLDTRLSKKKYKISRKNLIMILTGFLGIILIVLSQTGDLLPDRDDVTLGLILATIAGIMLGAAKASSNIAGESLLERNLHKYADWCASHKNQDNIFVAENKRAHTNVLPFVNTASIIYIVTARGILGIILLLTAIVTNVLSTPTATSFNSFLLAGIISGVVTVLLISGYRNTLIDPILLTRYSTNGTLKRSDVYAIRNSEVLAFCLRSITAVGLLWLFTNVVIQRPDIFWLGIIAILISHIFLRFDPDKVRHNESVYSLIATTKTFIVMLWVFASLVVLRDKLFSSWVIKWGVSEYWGLLGACATVFVLLLSFRITRLNERKRYEDTEFRHLYQYAEHYYERGFFDIHEKNILSDNFIESEIPEHNRQWYYEIDLHDLFALLQWLYEKQLVDANDLTDLFEYLPELDEKLKAGISLRDLSLIDLFGLLHWDARNDTDDLNDVLYTIDSNADNQTKVNEASELLERLQTIYEEDYYDEVDNIGIKPILKHLNGLSESTDPEQVLYHYNKCHKMISQAYLDTQGINSLSSAEIKDRKKSLVEFWIRLEQFVNEQWRRGRGFIELVALLAFALIAISVSLFAKPEQSHEDEDVSEWFSFVTEVFVSVFLATILFFCWSLISRSRYRDSSRIKKVNTRNMNIARQPMEWPPNFWSDKGVMSDWIAIRIVCIVVCIIVLCAIVISFGFKWF